MGPGRTALVGTFGPRTADELLRVLSDPEAARCDLVELRLDLVPHAAERLDELIAAAPVPVLATCRRPADGGAFGAWLSPPDGPPGPGVIMLHEIFGLNDWVRDTAATFLACADRAPEGAHVFNLHGDSVEVERIIALLGEIEPAARGKIDYDGPQIPIPPELDGSALDEALPNLPRTPLEEGMRRTVDRFRELLAAAPPGPEPITTASAFSRVSPRAAVWSRRSMGGPGVRN